MQELVKLFYKINIQGMDNFFGITSNQSMYTQGEFGGITQELVQPDGKITRNWGDNLIPLNFLKNWQNYFIKLIATEGTMFFGTQVTYLCTTKWNFGALLRNCFNLMTKHPFIEAKIRFL